MANEIKIERRIYEHQEAEIRAKYGEDAAQLANYGWAVITEMDHVEVATKVYLPTGAVIIASAANSLDDPIESQWEAC